MAAEIDPTTAALLAKVTELGPKFRERMRDQDVNSAFPFQSLAEATEAGLHKLCVPTEFGGYGYWQPGNYSGFYRILEELAYWEANTAQLLQITSHASGIVAWHATDEQRQRFLPEIVDGALLASLGS